MTALSLRKVVTLALADVDIDHRLMPPLKGRLRETLWLNSDTGLGLRRYSSGRAVYVVQTRMDGRVRTVTIGSAAVLSEAQAGSVAKRVMAYAVIGHNPAEDRKRIRAAPSYADFLEYYAQTCASMWKPSSRKAFDIYRRGYLDDAFPGKFIDEIETADVVRWFANVTNRSGPGGANKCLGFIRNMMNKAEAWGYRLENTNPVSRIRHNPRRKFERFLSDDELARVGVALNADRDGSNQLRSTLANAVLLLLLTGCRHSEILNLRWSDISGGRLKLRDSKTGPRTVWLGDDASALINSMPRHTKVEWLFWNASFKRQIRSVSRYWHRVQARAGISGLRVHDLRHTFASHAAMRSETLPMIGTLLGHQRVSSTLRYAHLDDKHILAAVEQVGDLVAQMMGDALAQGGNEHDAHISSHPNSSMEWPILRRAQTPMN